MRWSRGKKKTIEEGLYSTWKELLGGTSVNNKKFIEFQKGYLIGAVVAAKGDSDITVYDFPQNWLYALQREAQIKKTE